MAFGAGIVTAAALGDRLGRRRVYTAVFWVNVPVGIAAVIGARLRLSESRGPRTRVDVPGLALVSAGPAALIWAVVQGSQRGWTGTDVLVGLPLGAVLLGAFLIWEPGRRSHDPVAALSAPGPSEM
jgi:hypothetical protein